MKRKNMILFLCVIMMLIQTTGCSNNKANHVAMGRYLEEQIDFSKVNPYYMVLTSLQMGADHKLELYGVSNSSKRYTRNEDGTWKEEPLDWLSKLVGIRSITDALIVHGLDGSDYAMLAGTEGQKEGDSKARLYRQKADGKAEEIIIKRFDDYEVNGNWKDYYIPYQMYVYEDGSILIGYVDDVILYNRNGEILIDYQTDNGNNLTVSNDKVYILSLDMSQIMIYDKNSGNKLNSITVVNNGYNTAYRYMIHLFTGQNGEIYLQNKDGIHKLSKGGSLWETVVDGKLNSIASPSIEWVMACQADDGSFYLVSTGDYYSFYRYAYHPEVPAEPSTEISVYSLQEYKTIREAALRFQSEHPDVKVNYYAAMSGADKENTQTKEDLIKALNTEILTKKAADVIVLDDLDINSYMEKGVLDNISDIIDPMITSKELYEKVAQTYRNKGTILAVPISMDIPVALGSPSAVASSASLDQLAAYVEGQSKQSIFGDIDRSELIQLLYYRYLSEQIASHKIQREDLTGFFEKVGSIIKKTIGFPHYGESDYLGEIGILKNACELNMNSHNNAIDFCFLMQLASEVNARWQNINHQYEPKITVGINAFGNKKELAKEFIKLLLTDQIQNNWFYEGIPIKKDCATKQMTSPGNSSDAIMNMGYSYRNEFELYKVYAPSKESIKSYETMLEQLATPIFMDRNMKNKVIELTEQYLDGKLTTNAAADALLNFISLYDEE